MAKVTKVQLKREIYTYHAPWNTYAIAWSNRKEDHKSFRLAVGSFKLEYTNVVNVSARVSYIHLYHCSIM